MKACVFRGSEVTGTWKLATSPLPPISLQPAWHVLPEGGSSCCGGMHPDRGDQVQGKSQAW